MLKGLSITAGLRLSGAAAQVLLMLAVTRLCGAHEAGLYYFGCAVLFILAPLCRLGSELSGLREVAANVERGERLEVRQATGARVAVTLALALPAAVGFWAMPLALGDGAGVWVEGAAVVGILAAALPALALLGLFAELLKAVGRAEMAVSLQNLAVPGLAAGGLAGLALLGWRDAVAAALVTAAASWIALGLALAVWWRWWRIWSFGTGRGSGGGTFPRRVGRILREAPELVVVAGTSVLMQWIGSALLGLMAAPRDVAGFSVAMRLAIVTSVVNSAVMSVMSPRLAAAHGTRDIAGLVRLARMTSVFVMAATLPVLAVLGAVPEVWLSLFGAEFAAHAADLRLLLLGQVVAAVIGHSGTVLVMAGRYGSARWTSVLAAAVLAGLMPVLVPLAGVTGAAVAMSAGVIAGHVAGLVLVRRELGFWPVPLGRASLGGGGAA